MKKWRIIHTENGRYQLLMNTVVGYVEIGEYDSVEEAREFINRRRNNK